MKNIAITTTTFGQFDPSPIEECRRGGYNVVLNPHGRKINEDEFIDIAKNAVGIVAGTEKITKNALDQLPGLKIISRCGVGTDNVDLIAAEKNNIKVVTTQGAHAQAVAELTLGFMLDLVRGISQMDSKMRRGVWSKHMGTLLTQKHIGIVGFGRVGQKVAELLQPFKCTISFYDPYVESEGFSFQQLDLDSLCRQADIVSLHSSAFGTGLLLDSQKLNMMKKGSFLINTARGHLIDEKALFKALKDKHLAGAALDVFGQEPYNGRLKNIESAILTPHIGSYAKESRIIMEQMAVKNLLEGLQ